MTEYFYVGVDGGGTSTRVSLQGCHVACDVSIPVSINPASVGYIQALENFEQYVVTVLAKTIIGFDSSMRVVVGTAGFGGSMDQHYAEGLALKCAELAGELRVMVLNDLDPLVLAPGEVGGAALVLGTGSCAQALGHNRMIRVGGAEYIASDQGGSTYLGHRALIAAVKAFDGRGRATELLSRIEAFMQLDIISTARLIAFDPNPKLTLARLAPIVLDCAYRSVDGVAVDIVSDAVSEVREMVAAVLERSPLSRGKVWTATGGLLEHWPEYRTAIWHLGVDAGVGFNYVPDGAAACRQLAGMSHEWLDYARFVDCVVYDA